ncbi:MAG: ABC transporter permease, partial [Candidatus Limnocylindrales bacterium]
MNLIDLLALTRSRFRTGKLRTFLTMLGVIIGVASVVALVSVAQGATKGIGDRLQALGTNLLTVNPGFSATAGANRGQFGGATTLTLADSDAIAKLDNISSVAPQVSSNELVVAGLQNETVSVVGTTSTYADVFANQVWAGSFLSPLSVEHNMRVAVIGATTADNLGLTDNSVGSTIYIGGLPFDLIGILQPKGGT